MIYYLKDYSYKGKKYKFKSPLRVTINNFLGLDGKTMHGEMVIPEVLGGYTRTEPFNDPEKEIKEYIKTVFEDYLTKEDSKLDEYELQYKRDWIDLFLKPGEKVEKPKKIKIPTKSEIKKQIKQAIKK